MIKLKPLFETTFRTLNGSIIRRYNNNVGKRVGSQIYVHKYYAKEVIPKSIWTKVNDILSHYKPDFRFNTVVFDVKGKFIRFDEAPDFDIAREPHVGKYIIVYIDENRPPQVGYSDSIWHHKWLWVKDDYTGFDVDKAKEWSRIWLSKLQEPAKGRDLQWQFQLKNVGLNETIYPPPVVLGGIWEDGDIKAVAGENDLSRHPSGWVSCNKWRYVPEIEYLNFWEDPTDTERMMVRDFLERKGYKVSYVNVLTYNSLKKEMVMEDTEKLAEASLSFLMKMVQSGPFRGKVYLAGGAVRDMVMGKKPKDLDVVVVSKDIEGGMKFAIWLAQQMGNYKSPNSNPVLFPNFGTAKVNLTGVHNGVPLDGMEVEAVASRKEEYTPGSRKPKVVPGTLADDVFRRDFRANSLIFDLTTGEILDLTGKGKEDIKNGIIHTTSDPEIIFKEDPLRMLRAVRFMVQKGWKIDTETEESIKRNVHQLKNISMERIRDELNKMLITSQPENAIRKMKDLGILPYVSPELQRAVGMTQNKYHVHDVFSHTLEVLKNTKPELVQRLMALFHDIGKVASRSETPTGVHFYEHEDVGEIMADSILRKLKYPIEVIDAVKQGVKNHMKLKQGGDDAVKLSDKSLRKFKIELGDNLENVLGLIHADNIAHADASAMPNQIEKVRQRLKVLDIQVKKPNLPINGNDLIQMGVKQGPMIGQILSTVTDAWFENPNLTRDDAMAIVQRMI